MLQHSPIKTLPVVKIASEYHAGTNLANIAKLLNLAYEATPELDATKLVNRMCAVNSSLAMYAKALPDAILTTKLPGRERTILGLVNHIVEISASFIDVCGGATFTASKADAEVVAEESIDVVIDRTSSLNEQLMNVDLDPQCIVDTYYGDQSMHAVLNRCTCHVAQHLRQLDYFCDQKAIQIKSVQLEPILDGLYLPKKVWD